MPRAALFVLALLFAACETVDAPSAAGPEPSAGPATPAPGGASDWTPGRLATPGGTTDPDPGFPGQSAAGPKLQFTANGHDFGLQEKNAKVEHTAIFYNIGAEPITVRKVVTHCGCAAALLSSKTIPPGGRGTMRITLDTGGLAGDRVKRVEVFTDDPEKPIATYPISCTVLADAALDPLVLVIRATRSAGDVKSEFRVLNLRSDFDLKITEVRASNPEIRTEVSALPAAGEKKGYLVKLTFGPEFGARDFMEKVTVFTNSKRDPRLTLDVIGSVREAVLVVPERLYFPRMSPGQEIVRKVFVYRTDGRPLAITEVKDPAGLFEFEKKQVEPAKWEIVLKIHGEAPREMSRGSIVIRTDDPKEACVDLPYELPGGGGK